MKKILIFMLTLVLAGCGGGGSDPQPVEPQRSGPVPIVVFINSNCSGSFNEAQVRINGSTLGGTISPGQRQEISREEVGSSITIEVVPLGNNGSFQPVNFTVPEGGREVTFQCSGNGGTAAPTMVPFIIQLDNSCAGNLFDLILDGRTVTVGLTAGSIFETQVRPGAVVTFDLVNPNFVSNPRTLTIGAGGTRFTQSCSQTSSGAPTPPTVTPNPGSNPTNPNSNPTQPAPTPVTVQGVRFVGDIEIVEVFNTNLPCSLGTGTLPATFWDQVIRFSVQNPNDFGVNYFYRSRLSNGNSSSGGGTIFQAGGTDTSTSTIRNSCSIFQPLALRSFVEITETRQN